MYARFFINNLVLGVVTLVVCGCQTTRAPGLITVGSLAGESMLVLSRPAEFTLEDMGPATGSAKYTRFLFWKFGDAPETLFIPVLGRPVDRFHMAACAEAIEQKKGGEALYVTRVEVKKRNYVLFSTHTLRVTGRVMKMNQLETMDAKRADEIRSLKMPEVKVIPTRWEIQSLESG